MSAGPLTCTVTGLTDGTVYSFTVVATNGVGPSAPSGPSSPVTPFATGYDLVGSDGGVFVFDGRGRRAASTVRCRR